jgi:hypothetical protein
VVEGVVDVIVVGVVSVIVGVVLVVVPVVVLPPCGALVDGVPR